MRSRYLTDLLAILSGATIVVSAASGIERPVVDDRPRAASRVSTQRADTVPSPGMAIGITSRDWQGPGTSVRQVAANPGSQTVHFVWTMQDHIPYDDEDYWAYSVNYNSYDKLTGTLNPGPNGATVSIGFFDFDNQGGFARIDIDGANRCHAVFEQCLERGLPCSNWHLLFPLEGTAFHTDTELPDPASHPYELGQIWPDVAVTQNVGSNIRHVIAAGTDERTVHNLPTDHLWYWRYDEGAAVPSWEGPALIDSCEVAPWSIDACDNTDKVAVAFISDYVTDGFNEISNVVYRESHTAGRGWIDGSELGEEYKNFVTTYADPGGPQAWRETSVAYDHSGTLHIVFPVQREAHRTPDMAIHHWSDARGTVRSITTAYYDNNGTWRLNLNLSQISLGIGDGATPCEGGATTNEDYLYVLYTKLVGASPEEQADTSVIGYANGELYLSASPDGGNHWSLPVNLTNTKSPNCNSLNPDSVCASEGWGSIARDVSDIEIQYLRDYEAGTMHESWLTLNTVMYLSFPGGTVDAPLLCPTITCACPCLGDPQCDSVVNVLDVVRAVDVAFRGGTPVFDDGCPVERTNVDCSGATDVLDLVRFINVAFRGGDPAIEFCNPCAP
ncbi:MAG TPA: hypothetical protein VM118_07655 [Acidobacteriota bacterium]|nr:hypothetical protein [Acidobacteriota bacterium]